VGEHPPDGGRTIRDLIGLVSGADAHASSQTHRTVDRRFTARWEEGYDLVAPNDSPRGEHVAEICPTSVASTVSDQGLRLGPGSASGAHPADDHDRGARRVGRGDPRRVELAAWAAPPWTHTSTGSTPTISSSPGDDCPSSTSTRCPPASTTPGS